MDAPLQEIATYMGRLVSAAKHDAEITDPAAVGLHGIPVKQWREAYVEGLVDMATGIAARIPEAIREEFRALARATAATELERLRAEPADHK